MLTGWKSYIFTILAVLWTMTYIWKWLDITPEMFMTVLTLLGGGTVAAIRSAIK